MDKVNEEVESIAERGSFEKLALYLNFFIDFYNIAPFTEKNNEIALFLLYLLLLKADIEAFRYVSFFEKLHENITEFEKEVKNASFNWKEGFAQTMSFIRFMLKLILKLMKTDEIVKDISLTQISIKAIISKTPSINFRKSFQKMKSESCTLS